ncbi:hypothetical protein [Microcoleus sp. BROC3]|uniref:hypothetical protein n=1 Tax=Microcoleus sp. BROC3 TaxID=3055323 RepID=UPI002FD39FA6
MEPDKVITIFLKWLHENPSIFMPTAWKKLPQLEEEIAESADEELFPIAFTISKWCGKNGLGDALRDCLRKEIDDAGEPTPSTTPPLTNITQTLRQSIEDSYKKLQEIALDNQSDTSNDSK